MYIFVFAVLYLLWGISFTANDISYWSMLPALSLDQKEREKIGSFARICANVGLFFVVAGILPITSAIENSLNAANPGTNQAGRSYFLFTCLLVVIMWLGQLITLLGVKEPKNVLVEETHTSVKDLFGTLVKNDQLLFVAISMALFMIGYCTTTGFGLYYFKYAYGNESVYTLFAGVLGVSQISALIIFPLVSKKLKRKQLYLFATILVVVGYIIFFFAPTSTFVFIAISGILIFVGQAFIQLLMLMFLADSVEYGHWKSGKRNESITFSVQPFINKMGGAIASGIISIVIIVSGIKDAESAAEVTTEGLLILKMAMFVFPLLCIVIGFIIYRKKYKIDENMFQTMIRELKERGDIV
jgi:melibiose permease/lactose/raffinose/galactose permease